MERWLSGRKRTIRNRLTGDCSWVRIPPSPLYFLKFENFQINKPI